MMAMEEVAQKFSEYVALAACAAGVLMLGVLTLVGLYRVTLPAVRRLWGRSTRLGRFFGTLLFLVGSIYANTKPPVRKAPQSAAEQPQLRRIENWFRRGAWRDSRFLRFDPGWVFPLGTDHLPGVWIRSWGALADPLSRKPFAALGTELALFPDETEVFCGRTASNTYRIVWRNGFPDRRSRANPVSAAIELFRNGDIAVTTNGVTRFVPRELPFACAGRGQDADWVAANHPQHADAIDAAGGFAAWVDAAIGVGQTNGLYRFTADFRTTPPEAVELFVGPYTVAVTNAGAYVFLLEKGRDYAFGARPFVEDVAYSAADDTAETPRSRQQARGEWTGHGWTTDGGGLVWTAPTATAAGACCWLPSFRGAPDVAWLSPDWLPATFEGVLADAGASVEASYAWRTAYGNLEIESPSERETEVSRKDGGNPDAYELSVTATLGRHALTSTLAGRRTPDETNRVETALALDAPKVLLLPSNATAGAAEGTVKIDLRLAEGERGELTLACTQGAECIRLEGPTSWTVDSSVTKEVRITGRETSGSKDDVRLVARFVPEKGETRENAANLTVAKVWHEAKVYEPKNVLRKHFGVAEEVLVLWRPSETFNNVICDNGIVRLTGYGMSLIEVSHRPGHTKISLDSGFLTVTCSLNVIAPERIRAHVLATDFSRQIGIAGGINIRFRVYVDPVDVSFAHLCVQEVPRVATDAIGYFAQPEYTDYLDHGLNGAGAWVQLNSRNAFRDEAGVGIVQPPWAGGGSFTWPIPCICRLAKYPSETPTEFTHYTQRFELDADGTVRIKKFGYCAERATNNMHSLKGELK